MNMCMDVKSMVKVSEWYDAAKLGFYVFTPVLLYAVVTSNVDLLATVMQTMVILGGVYIGAKSMDKK